MDLVPLIDQLGENGAAIAGGAVIGIVFGFFAQRTGFCTRSALLDVVRGRNLSALAVWLSGFAVTILGVQLLLQQNMLSVQETRFFSTAQSLSGAIVGGLFILFVPNLAESISKGLAGAMFGVLLIVMMLVMPSGVAGFCRKLVKRLGAVP